MSSTSSLISMCVTPSSPSDPLCTLTAETEQALATEYANDPLGGGPEQRLSPIYLHQEE